VPSDFALVTFGDWVPSQPESSGPGISGVVFRDLNSNGIRDTGEPGITGVTITLKQGDSVVTATTTAEDGTYIFDGLTLGEEFTVVEIDPTGYTSTTPNEVNATVPPAFAFVEFGDRWQMSGDTNGDNFVNAVDITKLERMIAELDTAAYGADANLDGSVNSQDITRVERIIAQLD
jgi:hypothetical protein